MCNFKVFLYWKVRTFGYDDSELPKIIIFIVYLIIHLGGNIKESVVG